MNPDSTPQQNLSQFGSDPAEFLALAMDNLPQAIFYKDRNSIYLWCNCSFATHAGLEQPEDVVGKTDYDLPWTQEQSDFYRAMDQRVIQTGIPEIQIVQPQTQATGETRWLVANKVAMRDRAGNIIGVLGTFEAHSEYPEAHSSLLEAHEKLVDRLKESADSERAHRILAEALRDVVAIINTSLDVDEVLDYILDEIGRVVPHDKATIILNQTGDQSEVALAVREHSQHASIPVHGKLFSEIPMEQFPHFRTMAQTKCALIINEERIFTEWSQYEGVGKIRAYLGAPILCKDHVLGFINLTSATPGAFQSIHAERLSIFANQAGIAINNARLHEKAQALAASEERRRIARDLHDAVSQTMWTATLLSEVLPTLWDQDRRQGEIVLEKLHKLTQGAQAEMRALLMELRPETLLEVELADLIEQLAQAAMSHKNIAFTLNIEENPALPTPVKVTIFHVIQEAINNIVKHARASTVTIDAHNTANHFELRVSDNGRGFDLHKCRPDRMGLDIMQERADSIGAVLKIASTVGQGTMITLAWPLPTDT